nr:MAG TPA: hypothetical protein [Bacteriophage sp.]
MSDKRQRTPKVHDAHTRFPSAFHAVFSSCYGSRLAPR